MRDVLPLLVLLQVRLLRHVQAACLLQALLR
jgi:hypothetical protein